MVRMHVQKAYAACVAYQLEQLFRLVNLAADELDVSVGRVRLAKCGQVQQRLLECADVGKHLLGADLADASAAIDVPDQPRYERRDELVAEEAHITGEVKRGAEGRQDEAGQGMLYG